VANTVKGKPADNRDAGGGGARVGAKGSEARKRGFGFQRAFRRGEELRRRGGEQPGGGTKPRAIFGRGPTFSAPGWGKSSFQFFLGKRGASRVGPWDSLPMGGGRRAPTAEVRTRRPKSLGAGGGWGGGQKGWDSHHDGAYLGAGGRAAQRGVCSRDHFPLRGPR